jgi:pimeloyl-ACP methyl ester carboxylesterase
VTVPVLQVHGTSDPSILVSSLGDTADRVDAPYEQVLIEAGHYPHEEAPTLFNGALISWLNTLE